MDEIDEWGKWECPVCGEEHEDKNSRTITSCRRCEAIVVLSEVDDNNRRVAFLRDD